MRQAWHAQLLVSAAGIDSASIQHWCPAELLIWVFNLLFISAHPKFYLYCTWKKIIKACFLQYRSYTFLEILKGSKAEPPAAPHACQFFPVAAGESAAFSGMSPSGSGRRREGMPSTQGKGSLNPRLPLEPPLGLQDSLNWGPSIPAAEDAILLVLNTLNAKL